MIVYFSNVSGYTKRFINKLDLPNVAIPIYKREPTPTINEPAILVCPSYGTGDINKAVPHRVKEFLNIKENRDNIVGIIATGNRTFGKDYLLAGRILKSKLKVPILYSFELSGLPEDVERVREIYSEVMQH